jgi:hypothetical protein
MADAGRLDLVDDPLPVAGRLDRHRRSAITAGEKLCQRIAFMLDPLLADQSASSRATEAATEDGERVDVDKNFVLSVLGVTVGRIVVVEEDPDHDPVEPTDLRHPN